MANSILGEYLFNEALTGILGFGSMKGILTWKPNHIMILTDVVT